MERTKNTDKDDLKKLDKTLPNHQPTILRDGKRTYALIHGKMGIVLEKSPKVKFLLQ